MKYINLTQIIQSDKYPFTLGQMRGFLLHREENGLSQCVYHIGRRLYLREDLFDRWIESQKEEGWVSPKPPVDHIPDAGKKI